MSATAKNNRLYYCHCDECAKLQPRSLRYMTRQGVENHKTTKRFSGVRYNAWKETIGKYNLMGIIVLLYKLAYPFVIISRRKGYRNRKYIRTPYQEKKSRRDL